MSTTHSTNLDQKDLEFLSNFSVSLIHRILRTDPTNFSSLTFSGQPISHEAHSYIRHCIKYVLGTTTGSNANATANDDGGGGGSDRSNHWNLKNHVNLQSQIEWTMKKAFHNGIVESIQTSHNFQALKPLILELYSNLKNLVPNRTDLHALLKIPSFLSEDKDTNNEDNEEDTNNNSSSRKLNDFTPLLENLILVADALKRLESEFQSESTERWIIDAKNVENTLKEQQHRKGGGGGQSNSILLENDDKYTTSPVGAARPLTLTLTLSEAEEEECIGLGMELPLTMSVVEYAVASATYLHAKIEQCQMDVANFQLSHVLAPRIHALGIDYLRLKFQKQFFGGGGENPLKENKLPHTKSWIQELVVAAGEETTSTYSKEKVLKSINVRRTMIWTSAWIRNLLFRSPRNPRDEEPTTGPGSTGDMQPKSSSSSSPFLLPEVFIWDLETIQDIRKITQWSVVGSALALHASNAAGVGQGVLQIPLGQNIMVDNCRQDLKDCLQGKTPAGGARGDSADGSGSTMIRNQEGFENGIIDKVLTLAQAWNQSLTSVAQETIRSRCIAVLHGTDPVLQLFDTRMRGIFEAMVVWIPSQADLVPSTLKSGISIPTSNSTSTKDDPFLRAAKRELTSKGFAFYAQDLADAALKSRTCIDLVWKLFGNEVLDHLLVDAFNE